VTHDTQESLCYTRATMFNPCTTPAEPQRPGSLALAQASVNVHSPRGWHSDHRAPGPPLRRPTQDRQHP